MKMNKIVTKHIALLFRIIALVAIIGFFPTACGEKPDEEIKLSGTVTADTEGKITFMYSRMKSSHPEYCTFTADLPAPDDKFIITITSGQSTGKKEIEGLETGQKVTWAATVKGKPLNHGSESFVHIVND